MISRIYSLKIRNGSRSVAIVRKTSAKDSATVNYLINNHVIRNVFSFTDPPVQIDQVETAIIEENIPIEVNTIGLNKSPIKSETLIRGDFKWWTQKSEFIISGVAQTYLDFTGIKIKTINDRITSVLKRDALDQKSPTTHISKELRLALNADNAPKQIVKEKSDAYCVGCNPSV